MDYFDCIQKKDGLYGLYTRRMDCKDIQEENVLNGLYLGGGWIKWIVSRKIHGFNGLYLEGGWMDCIQKEDELNGLYLGEVQIGK